MFSVVWSTKVSCTKQLGNVVERDGFFDATDFKEDIGGGVKLSLLEVFQRLSVKFGVPTSVKKVTA